VPSSTDLVQLLSYAGGPIQYAKLDDVKLTRVTRTDGNTNKQEYSINLERLDKLSDQEIELRPGDTIFIDHVAWISIRDAFNVVTTAACPPTCLRARLRKSLRQAGVQESGT